MTDPPPFDPDPLARALARLRPADPDLDVPALLYRAGRQSRDAAVGRWRRAAVVAAAGWLAAGYAVYVVANRPAARPAPPDVLVLDPGTDPNLDALSRAIVGGVRSRNAAIDAGPAGGYPLPGQRSEVSATVDPAPREQIP